MIKRIILGPVETNCYFLINGITCETVVFDPADSPDIIADFIFKNGLKPVAVCLTHGHYDHITGIEGFRKIYDVPVYADINEKEVLSDGELNHSLLRYGHAVTVQPDHFIKDGDVIKLAGFDIKLISTPGHTEGSCCYYIESEKILISGDTLFEGSVGRTDLPTGSMAKLMLSVNSKLKPLPDDTDVYPGHGGYTTIGDEKKYNPYFE